MHFFSSLTLVRCAFFFPMLPSCSENLFCFNLNYNSASSFVLNRILSFRLQLRYFFSTLHLIVILSISQALKVLKKIIK